VITSNCCCDTQAHSFNRYISYQNEKTFKEYEGTVIGKCSSCGLLKTFAVPKSAFNPKQSDVSFYEKNVEFFSHLFAPTITGIQKYHKKGSVLDIGCSSGILLRLLHDKGYDVFGIEPNDQAYVRVKNTFGSRIYHGVLNTYETKKSFDVVILSHVLEHVPDPTHEIALIKNIISKNGILIIGIPNTRNIVFLLRQKYWEYLRPKEHIWHFSDTYLVDLLERNGFQILEKWYVNDARKEYPLMKRIYFSLLCFVNTLIGTGETVSIICRK
jgi:2-polyprenyl-3-methyl-5-hydroxy-6-metoxy-1,4-benzoquinol methylase